MTSDKEQTMRRWTPLGCLQAEENVPLSERICPSPPFLLPSTSPISVLVLASLALVVAFISSHFTFRMTFSTLRELHALIGTAINDIERVYLQASPPSFPPLYPQSPPSPLSPRSRSPSPRSSPSYYSPISDYSEDEAADADVSALPTPVSVTFAISASPKKKKRHPRSRAYTLPHLNGTQDAPLVWTPPKPILRMPPEPPLDFPDLETPYFPSLSNDKGDQASTDKARSVQERAEQRTRDRQAKSEDLTAHIDVIGAVNKIVAACGQLSASVQKPFLTLCDAAMGYHLPSCLRFVEEAHIVEILRDAGPDGLHVKDIAERVTNFTSKSVPPGSKPKVLDPARLSHILRLLATHHITREVRPDVFTNNRVSSFMDTGKRVEDLFEAPDAKYEGTNGVSAFVGLCADECFKASAYLTDAYLPSRMPTVPVSHQVSTPPSCSPTLSPTHSPITFSSNSPSDAIEGPATPKQGQSLRRGLDACNQRTPTSTPSLALASSSGVHGQGLTHQLSLSTLANPPPFTPSLLNTNTPTSSPASTKSPGLLKRISSKPLLGPAFSLSGFKDSSSKMGKKASISSFASSDGKGSNHSSDLNGVSGIMPGAPVQVFGPALGRSPLLSSSPVASRRPSLASLRSPPSPTLSSPPPVPPLPSLSKLGHYGGSSSSLDLSFNMAPAVSRNSGTPHRMSSRSSLLSGSGISSVPSSPINSPTARLNHHRQTSSLSPIPDTSSPLKLGTMRKSPPLLSPPSSPVDNPPPPQTRITPAHPMHAPFNLAFQTEKPYFEWLEGKDNVARLKRFGKAMTGTSGWEGGAVVDCLPWGDLPTDSFVVDVGGGVGSTSMILAKAYKHLRFVIQDRPQVAEMGIKAWKERYPELLEDGTATFQGHDFFTPQPPLPDPKPRSLNSSLDGTHGSGILGPDSPEPCTGTPTDRVSMNQSSYVFPTSPPQSPPPALTSPSVASVFLLRVITHDWPDAFVTRILLHLRQAAGPDTKLVLADYVLPLACVDEELSPGSGDGEVGEALPGHVKSLAPEGSPLLPNFGKANANAYWLDLTMRVMFNAQERTLRELTALTLTAGWKVVRVTRAEGTLFGHIIAVPVEIPPDSLRLLEPNSIEGEGSCITVEGVGESGQPSELYSPPMGDTFFSRVDLPSEDAIIRSSMRNPANRSRKKSSGFVLGLSGLGFGRKKRDRAHTITASASAPLPTYSALDGTPVVASEVPPAVPPKDCRPMNLTSLDLPPSPTTRREPKKPWKTLVRMLSKPQLNTSAATQEADNDPSSFGTVRLR